jgi:hypothetical protein
MQFFILCPFRRASTGDRPGWLSTVSWSYTLARSASEAESAISSLALRVRRLFARCQLTVRDTIPYSPFRSISGRLPGSGSSSSAMAVLKSLPCVSMRNDWLAPPASTS